MKQLTVIIPTFERPKMTMRAIKSVFHQDIACEVIVVDDCSPTPFVLPESFSGKVSVLRHDNNNGAAAARNTGVAAARTPYITFLDSDDELLPQTLGVRLQFAQQTGDVMTVTGCGWVDRRPDRPDVLRVPKPGSDLESYMGGCWFAPGSTVIFPANVLKRVGPINERLRRLEDVDWTIRFALQGGTFQRHDIAGAIVHYHTNKVGTEIADAREFLLSQMARRCAEDAITLQHLQRFKAYMALEDAAAARRSGKPFRAMTHLFRSWLQKPRTRLVTSPGWDYRAV